jgi:tetratricopeptide (TPR) repeat protein
VIAERATLRADSRKLIAAVLKFYNQLALKRIILLAFLLLVSVSLFAAEGSKNLVILPFENTSKAPGIEWIGEAFPEVLGQRLSSTSLYVVSREDRMYAVDRAGIPPNVRPSRATLFRIAEQMDADYMVVGSYTFDGQLFSAAAQLVDLKALKMTPEVKESAPLVKLLDVENALAWDLMRQIDPQFNTPRDRFISMWPPIRLDAFENYIRGVTAVSRQDKIRYFREAVRLNPSYTQAMLQLGRVYFAGREYESAASWFNRVPRSDASAGEAAFFSGLSRYYLGDYAHAQQDFVFVAQRLPLTEVNNNLGVVAARTGNRKAAEYFMKAIQADPNDPDYRFNLALTLYRAGDMNGAARELREVMRLKPNDSEAKQLLDSVNAAATARPAGTTPPQNARIPLERIKRNYDENSFRQLAAEIENAKEMRLANADPKTHAAAHADRGRELLAQNFYSEAEKEFRESLRIDPDNAAAHAGLAQVMENNNDAGGARDEAQKSLALQQNAAAYLVLANLDLKDNNPESASENVGRALRLEPNNPAARSLQKVIASKTTQPVTRPQ